MAALITPQSLRDDYGIETDLSDTALIDIIAAEQRAIERVGGVAATVTERRFPGAGERLIELGEDAGTISSVTEDGTALVADTDYTFYAPRTLQREGSAWKAPVVVVYVPEDEFGRESQQRMALVRLVKLYLAFNGYRVMGGPELRLEGLDYPAARNAILAEVALDWQIV